MNMDNPRHDEDPENDGHDERADYCTDCGELELLYKDELCPFCYSQAHGPGNDKDLDPERHGDYSIDIQHLKDAGRGHLC